MDEDGARPFTVGLSRWGGVAVVFWSGSQLLGFAMVLFHENAWVREMVLEPYGGYMIMSFMMPIAAAGVMFVVGALLWREGQRGASARLPVTAFERTYLKAFGAAIVALGLLWLLGHVLMRSLVLTRGNTNVFYQLIRGTDAALAFLFVAGGAYRCVWAWAGLGGRRRAGILEGALGVCAGAFLLSEWFWLSFVNPIPSAAVALVGGIVAVRSCADALLLLRRASASA